MKILVTGKGGGAGSWQIRGQQLGAAIGARIKPMATLLECQEADVIVAVKRCPPDLLDTIRRSRRPWVFDMVDCWPQPSEWDQARAVEWLRSKLAGLKPTGVVFGTPQMEADSAWGGRSLVLPHHSWQRYMLCGPRISPEIRILGYEGAPSYLGRWQSALQDTCSRRGFALMINGDMRIADVGLALRDGGGYPARYWKPGTKLSNLHALAIPAICSREAGYEHVSCGAELFVDDVSMLNAALDQIQTFTVRSQISERMRAASISIGTVAVQYKTWLQSLL